MLDAHSLFGTLWPQTVAEPWEGNIYTGQVSLRNQFTSNVTGYASVQYGEKPGFAQFNGLLPDGSGAPRNLPVDKEKTTTFEVGVRTNWLNGDLILNANVFRADIGDFQQNVFFLDDLLTEQMNDGTLYYSSGVGNVAKVRSQGVEVDFAYNASATRRSAFLVPIRTRSTSITSSPASRQRTLTSPKPSGRFRLHAEQRSEGPVQRQGGPPPSDTRQLLVPHQPELLLHRAGDGDAALSSYGWNKAYESSISRSASDARTGCSTSISSSATCLTKIAATKAGTPTPSISVRAGSAERVLVDWHSHYLSEAELNFLATRTAAPRLLRAEDGSAYIDNLATASGANLSFNGVAASNVEARLRQMDENGVRWQLLCQTIPLGFDATLPLDEQKRLYKRAKPMWIRSANSHTGPQPKAASEAGQTRAPDYVPDLI